MEEKEFETSRVGKCVQTCSFRHVEWGSRRYSYSHVQCAIESVNLELKKEIRTRDINMEAVNT